MWTGLREPVGELSQSTPLRPKGVKGRDDVIRSWGELESWRRTTYLDCRHRKKQLFQDPSCKTERAKGKKCPDLLLSCPLKPCNCLLSVELQARGQGSLVLQPERVWILEHRAKRKNRENEWNQGKEGQI